MKNHDLERERERERADKLYDVDVERLGKGGHSGSRTRAAAVARNVKRLFCAEAHSPSRSSLFRGEDFLIWARALALEGRRSQPPLYHRDPDKSFLIQFTPSKVWLRDFILFTLADVSKRNLKL